MGSREIRGPIPVTPFTSTTEYEAPYHAISTRPKCAEFGRFCQIYASYCGENGKMESGRTEGQHFRLCGRVSIQRIICKQRPIEFSLVGATFLY